MTILAFLSQAIHTANVGWFQLKSVVEANAGVGDDALHLMAGTLLQLALAVIMRMSVSRWWPWLIVLGLEILNELADLRSAGLAGVGRESEMHEVLRDLLLTMFLPTVLLIVARKFPRVLAR